MYFIDIHTHVYPDAIAQKATDSVREFYGIGGADGMNGTVSQLRSRGAQAGTTKYVILPVAMTPNRTRSINEFILRQTAQYDDFIGFGAVHAAMEDIGGEAKFILANGLRGVKIHPDTQGFAIDDPRLFPMYEAIEGRIPVMLHMGDHRYDYSHPIRLRRILDQFPRLQAVGAHFGGHTMYAQACDILKDTQCILDVSSALMIMQPGDAEKYINIYGAERMAFGTDYPLWDPVKETKRFLQLKLTDEQFEQIGHKTVERILNL